MHLQIQKDFLLIQHDSMELFIAFYKYLFFFIVIYSANFFIDIDSVNFFIDTHSVNFFNVLLNTVLELIKIATICFLGAGISSMVMGIYLYITNLFFDMHIDEASSSLACRHYKNFLRIKVHSNGVTIYPIGIENVPEKWRVRYNEKIDAYSFSGKKVESFLIENPIEIKL